MHILRTSASISDIFFVTGKRRGFRGLRILLLDHAERGKTQGVQSTNNESYSVRSLWANSVSRFVCCFILGLACSHTSK